MYLGKCEDKNLSGCSLNGQSVGCDQIEMASFWAQMSVQDVCNLPVSQFSCDGSGTVKDYCPNTCFARCKLTSNIWLPFFVHSLYLNIGTKLKFIIIDHLYFLDK